MFSNVFARASLYLCVCSIAEVKTLLGASAQNQRKYSRAENEMSSPSVRYPIFPHHRHFPSVLKGVGVELWLPLCGLWAKNTFARVSLAFDHNCNARWCCSAIIAFAVELCWMLQPQPQMYARKPYQASPFLPDVISGTLKNQSSLTSRY